MCGQDDPSGTSASAGRLPTAMRTARMIPIVFWASLPPCPRLKAAADASWPRRKPLFNLVDVLFAVKQPLDDHGQQEPESEPDQRREHYEGADRRQALGDEDIEPAAHDRRACHATDESVRRAGGEAKPKGQQVPSDRTEEAGEDHPNSECLLDHHVLGDGVGDVCAEDEKCDEVEEGGPDHRIAGVRALWSTPPWRSSWPRRGIRW